MNSHNIYTSQQQFFNSNETKDVDFIISQLKKLKNHSPSFNYQDIDPKSLNVLIVGKDDKNTPPGVSEYYYDLLKDKNKQVKLHIIDGGHGLRSMPTIGSVVNEYIN